MKNKEKFNKLDWSHAILNWGRYTSPFRLSSDDVEVYSSVLRKFKNKKRILLLGSTPEIREVLSSLDFEIVVADFSYEMLQGMIYFGDIDIDKEWWVKADWMILDKFLKNNYFDLILGDLVLRNIDFGRQNKFLKIISSLLNEKGMFISRIHHYDEKMSLVSQKKIVEDVLSLKNISQKLKEDLITSRLFDKYTERKNKTINKKLFLEAIGSNKKILKNIYKKWGDEKRTWTQHTKQEIQEMLKKYFYIEERKIAEDYIDSKFYPTYV